MGISHLGTYFVYKNVEIFNEEDNGMSQNIEFGVEFWEFIK